MRNDPTDTVLSLGNCSAVVETAADIRRFRVHSAVLSRRGRRRVGLRFEGPQGSITIELSLVTSGGLRRYPTSDQFRDANKRLRRESRLADLLRAREIEVSTGPARRAVESRIFQRYAPS
jgi:hypothetical protein